MLMTEDTIQCYQHSRIALASPSQEVSGLNLFLSSPCFESSEPRECSECNGNSANLKRDIFPERYTFDTVQTGEFADTNDTSRRQTHYLPLESLPAVHRSSLIHIATMLRKRISTVSLSMPPA